MSSDYIVYNDIFLFTNFEKYYILIFDGLNKRVRYCDMTKAYRPHKNTMKGRIWAWTIWRKRIEE